MDKNRSKKKYDNIVWDWNGTLLNDVEIGWRTLNRMLEKRKLSLLTLQDYKDIFGFPVENFYRVIGFNLEQESLHELSVDFVEIYDTFSGGVCLNEEAIDVLEQLNQTGKKQYILSALREDLLKGMVKDFQIEACFEKVCGSDNIYAAGKVERGKRMVENFSLDPRSTLMVGDTLHDAEVAEALGFDCVLYAGGHNSEWRLKKKAPVITKMKELLEF